MKLRFSVSNFASLVQQTVKNYIVELMIVLVTYIFHILEIAEIIDDCYFLILSPIAFTVAYALNNNIIKASRLLYYLSWVPFLGLAFLGVWKEWSSTSQSVITVTILSPLLLLLCRKAIKNSRFVEEGLVYAKALLISVVFSYLIFLLFIALTESILYLFPIDGVRSYDIYEYAHPFINIVVMPFIALMAIKNSINTKINSSKLLDVMINYIISPSVIIYAALLYLYSFKSLFTWELPQGGVAIMVFIFTIIALIVKSLHNILGVRLFGWFYQYFSFISIPALIMFWMGVIKRINDYGLTDWRVYLVVCGVIMTIGVMMFATKRYANYYFLALFSFALYLIMAYIPGLSAQDIALRSQVNRVEQLSKELNLLDENGHINKNIVVYDADLKADSYEQLRSAIYHIEDLDTLALVHIGINNRDDFDSVTQSLISLETTSKGERKQRYIRADDNKQIDITGYKYLYSNLSEIYDGDDGGSGYINTDNGIEIRLSDGQVFTYTYDEMILSKLRAKGIDTNNISAINESIMDMSEELLTFKTDSMQIGFTYFLLKVEDNVLSVDYLYMSYLLMK